jgi:hypothetical protein
MGNRDLVEIGISQAPFEVGREDNASVPPTFAHCCNTENGLALLMSMPLCKFNN